MFGHGESQEGWVGDTRGADRESERERDTKVQAGRGDPDSACSGMEEKRPIRNHLADLADNHCVDNNGEGNGAFHSHAKGE